MDAFLPPNKTLLMKFGIIILLMAFQCTLFSQGTDGGAVNDVLKRFESELNVIDPGHYKAQMFFTGFGEDTSVVRNFLISYKSNENNHLYGYDFQITELIGNSDTLTHMVLDSALYIIYNKSKQVSERKLPDVVDLGSYLEYLRYSFIFKEVFRPFLNSKASDITLVDSFNQFCLLKNVNEIDDQQLLFDKTSFLPYKHVSIIKDQDFGFNQITEILFTFDSTKNILSNSAFSIEYYLSLGYTHKVFGPKLDTAKLIPQIVSFDNHSLLLNYPFTLANGDTGRIKDYTAKYILLDFWFSSCLPCLKALPEIDKLSKYYKEQGLEAIGINCIDTAPKKNLEETVRKKDVGVPLLFGDRNLTQAMGITSFPSYLLIYPDRKIEYIQGGIDNVKQILGQIFGKK